MDHDWQNQKEFFKREKAHENISSAENQLPFWTLKNFNYFYNLLKFWLGFNVTSMCIFTP